MSQELNFEDFTKGLGDYTPVGSAKGIKPSKKKKKKKSAKKGGAGKETPGLKAGATNIKSKARAVEDGEELKEYLDDSQIGL